MDIFFFFFQAEDGIRDVAVTGVQTCALPIWIAAMTAFNADDRYSSHAPARISKAIPSPSAGNTLEGVAWNTPALPNTKASTSQPRSEAVEATAKRLRASVSNVERYA